MAIKPTVVTQSMRDELRKQAIHQSTRNYKCIEIDVRTVIAMLDELEEHDRYMESLNDAATIR
jgi:hypothetical protein